MPSLVLIHTMISNADMTGMLRSPKSQSSEVVEPTLTGILCLSQKFAEIGDCLAYLLWCLETWVMGKNLSWILREKRQKG